MTRERVQKAKEALGALHSKALGNDYANEYELRSQFYAVFDVLEDLMLTLPAHAQVRGTQAMTHQEALKVALDALHKIALGAHARQQVDEGRLATNELLRIGQIQRAMTVREIEDYAIETWEAIVSNVDAKEEA